jgi:hypothetical protein
MWSGTYDVVTGPDGVTDQPSGGYIVLATGPM